MKITVDESLFIDRFVDYDRVGKGKNFSYAGCRALFEYLEELEDGNGEELELDVVALCCDYSEYSTLEDAMADYGYDDEDEFRDDCITLIEFNGGVIIQV